MARNRHSSWAYVRRGGLPHVALGRASSIRRANPISPTPFVALTYHQGEATTGHPEEGLIRHLTGHQPVEPGGERSRSTTIVSLDSVARTRLSRRLRPASGDLLLPGMSPAGRSHRTACISRRRWARTPSYEENPESARRLSNAEMGGVRLHAFVRCVRGCGDPLFFLRVCGTSTRPVPAASLAVRSARWTSPCPAPS